MRGVDLDLSSYNKVRPYWEAWKNNTKRPIDSEEAKRCDTMVQLFLAVARQTDDSIAPEALNYLKTSIGEWRGRLKRVGLWDESTQRLKLFRGLRNEAAIDARHDEIIRIPSSEPICFSYKRDSALGFAGQGNCEGALISVEGPLNSVVFADVDQFYRDGNMHEEAEVVVVLPESVVARLEVDRVSKRARLPRSKTEKSSQLREEKRLKALEERRIRRKCSKG